MAPKSGFYCTTCAAQAESNDTNKPTHGDIRDRMEEGGGWRSPAGKQPINYGNVMQKKNIEKDAAITEATAFGWEIAEEQFEVKARKTGRPKSPASSDTEDDKPKKTKKVKIELTDEEKAEKKKLAAEKRKAKALAKKKAEEESKQSDEDNDVLAEDVNTSSDEEDEVAPQEEVKTNED